ncbi:hypothetical protein [Winogradskyella sp. 3972H.M.0a.05]|uniref:hypothetical protein n=1 Tax=Winogradskyella sp. 3972H.M.0a.05 TaxID=2950277 RepID=UPI003397EEF7
MKDLLAIYFFLLFFTCYSVSAQVGVGTTDPTAELEIETTDTGIPALELNPQSSPTGNTTGQIAVIGDKLFMYDATRSKWLSVEVTPLQLGRSGGADDTNLRTVGNQNNNRSGYLMPFDGTITYVSVKSNSNNGAQSKEFSIQVRNGNTTNSATTVTTSASEYTNSSLNIDFSAGDFINGRIIDDGNGDVNNVSMIVWVKWRN